MLEDYAKVQPVAFQIMKNTVKKDRISHAYLIETNGFSQKKDFVFAFAKYLLCPFHHLQSDETCFICRHQNAENILDLKWIEPDGMWIKKEQLEDVQKEFNKTAIDGNKKVYVIEEAEKLNASSSNSILKFLEEPEENIIAILMVDNIYQLLPTIISRCQIIHLNQDDDKNLLYLDSNTNEIVDVVYHFMEHIEVHKKETLLYENTLWISHFCTKEDVSNALTVLIYFYKDIFNVLVNKRIEKFSYYKKELENLSLKNTVESVCTKIDIIRNKLEQIKININLNLLIDDLIIQLSEV